MIGSTLAHYRITGELGSGGMGEVWRAEDEKLGREVALKVLPADVAEDRERLARFEREAKVLASLNHPNIAHLYGLETVDSGAGGGGAAGAESRPQDPKTSRPQDPTTFLVMELVEGEDLSDRIARGPIPVDEAIPIALQIAEALEAAHEQGIVHRDLKPANIKLTEDGTVKVLDFGLAKAWESESSDSSLSLSPTMTQHATAAGVILGTAAYMSPEQARGKKVDRRADIWAFGVVLWEMLTGRKLFEGETVSDVMAAILTREPDLDALQDAVPSGLKQLVGRCLRRDPKMRKRDIGDVRVELAEPFESAPGDPLEPPGKSAWPVSRIALWSVAALSLPLALIFGALWLGDRDEAPGNPASLSVVLPADLSLGKLTLRPVVSLAPHGLEMVIAAFDGTRTRLHRRSLSSNEILPLEGTDGGNAPFYSPDGRWIGFTSGHDGELKKLSLESGQVVTLAGGDWGGGSWGEDGTIVFTPDYTAGLWVVSEAGGDETELTRPDPEVGELNHSWPDHVPGTDAIIFTSFRLPMNESRTEILDLATGERRLLIENAVFARYVAAGFVLFVRDHTLLAARFDPRSLELVGPPVPVFGDAFVSSFEGNSQFDVADNGTLAWVPASIMDPPREVVSVDRQGRIDVILEAERRYSAPALSPDGTRLALTVEDDNPDIWIHDLERLILNRVTSSPRSEHSPIWTPDGERLVFVVDDPPFNIYSVSADGGDDLRPIVQSPYDSICESITPDGRWLVFRHSRPETGLDLEIVPIAGGAEPVAIRASAFEESSAAVSPGGEYLAYHANDSGRQEIYIQALEGAPQRAQVSRSGGYNPRWGSNGELFFWRGGELLSVEIRMRPRLEIGEPSVLFTMDRYASTTNPEYTVSPDGRRFVMARVPEVSKPREIRVVLNWFAELDRLTDPGASR
jgi:serine/threonine-protein kinase